MSTTPYGTRIPDANEFEAQREINRRAMGADEDLRERALELQVSAERFAYGYQQEWLGIPIIRIPDDIVVQQEIVWAIKPAFIVETGIARGGSLALSASLMAMAGSSPRVLGLDIKILPHAKSAIDACPYSGAIFTWEGDSGGSEAAQVVAEFIEASDANRPGILVLDSDHTRDHVLTELRSLGPLLPLNSVVLVADTLIEELPNGHYPDRPWGPGNGPLSAVSTFLQENAEFSPSTRWGRRGLLTEFRDGILEKTGDGA